MTRLVPTKVGMILVWAVVFVLLISGQGHSASAAHWTQKGQEFLQKGEPRKALTVLKKALNQNSRHLPALLGLTRAYKKIGAYGQALTTLKRAEKLRMKLDEVYALKGEIHLDQGQLSKAMAALQKSLQQKPDNLAAQLAIAKLLHRQGHLRSAQSRLDRLHKRFPMSVELYLEMARVSALLERWDRARRWLEKAKFIDSQDGRIYLFEAKIAIEKFVHSASKDSNNGSGDLRRALEVLATKEKLDGPSSSLYYQKAYVHMLLKNWEQAYNNFNLLFDRKSNNPLHYYLAGYVAEKRGQNKKAYEHYLKAYKLEPNDSVLRVRLEHFMNRRGYSENHPIRRRLARERLRRARMLFQKNLVQTAYFELRRALWLDSHLLKARRRLLQYYRYHGYFPEYLRELRQILRILPQQRAQKRSQYQLRLQQSIRQRRRKLYHKAGLGYPFGRQDISVAVAPARVAVRDRLHPGLAETYQRAFRFYLDQTERFAADQKGALLQVHSRVKERPLGMSVSIQVRLRSLGLTVLDFDLEENGSNALDQIIQRAIQRLNDQVPRWGQVIKQKVGGELFINLGKVDGVSEGDQVYIFARREPEQGLRLANKKDQARFQGKVVDVDSHVAKVAMNSNARGVWFGEKDLVFVGPKKSQE